jgi:zinc-ribbon domain
MVCQVCGAAIEEGVHFCPKCGAQVAAAQPAYAGYPPASAMPMYRPVPRVQRHLQTLGILWCVFGVYRIVTGLLGMFFFRAVSMHRFGGGWPFDRYGGPFGPPWMSTLLPVIAFVTVVAAALALLVGFSLLTRKPWGRTIAIIIAVLSLMKFPVGTALGIYTLWVLAPAASGTEYDAIADPT